MPVTDPLERLRSAGRNDDCPCGSGKKYKKCHLREDEETASKALAKANAAADAEAKAAAEAEEAGHEGHGHAPGAHPTKSVQAGPAGGPPKTPLSHKPMSTPRKAV
jgi:hypothetical protein